jgi:hypothetical protein
MIDTSKAFNQDTFMCEEFIRLKEAYGIKTVIETGTYKGETTGWLSLNFDSVFTTEIDVRYHTEAKATLKEAKNINFILSDSLKALPEVLKKCTDKTLLFLDSHWGKNPLLQELEIIARSGLKPVIAIHDFKNPNHPEYGFDIYPEQNIVYEWSWVEKHIKAIYGEGGFVNYYNDMATGAKRGCLFIVPK